jgi:beta-N-acetylhexosaminidase
MARLDASLRRLLETKQRLGLFGRRTVPIDSIQLVVGGRKLLETAEDIAARAVTLVRDTIGTLQTLRTRRQRVTVIAYADELNSTVGLRITETLRSAGDTVSFFRLWPMSGTLSYDSARVAIARSPTTIFAANVRPLTSRGNIAMPDSLARLILATDAVKPTVLVSLGSPYLLNQASTVRSYLLAWSGTRVAERAAGRALAGLSPIKGHLPIRIPPDYPVGHGIVIADSMLPPPPAPPAPRP